MSDGTIIAVAGAKGGVGKTTTTINLAAAARAATMEQSVVVVEADLAMANVIDFVDLPFDPDRDRSLHDVLAGDCPITDVFYEAPGGFDVVPSGPSLGGFAKAEPRKLGDAIRALRSERDLVLVDTGAGVSYETMLPIGVADVVLLVSTLRQAAVRDARKTKILANRVDTPVGGVVFTKVGTGSAPPTERITDFLDVDLLGEVPADETVPDAQDAGQPVIVHDIASPAAEAYWRIAEELRIVRRDFRPESAVGSGL